MSTMSHETVQEPWQPAPLAGHNAELPRSKPVSRLADRARVAHHEVSVWFVRPRVYSRNERRSCTWDPCVGAHGHGTLYTLKQDPCNSKPRDLPPPSQVRKADKSVWYKDTENGHGNFSITFTEQGMKDPLVGKIIRAETGPWWTLMHRCNLCSRHASQPARMGRSQCLVE